MITHYVVYEAHELTDEQWDEMKREYEELHSDSQGNENTQWEQPVFIASNGEKIPF